MPGGRVARAPCGFVGLENVRVGEPKAIDALLHVADEKAIAGGATQRGEDGVLRGVDVLIFVHEDVREPALPGRGNPGLAQQFERVLFEVAKVHAAKLAFARGKLSGELAFELQQREHGLPRPFPILHQRIMRVVRPECGEKRDFIEEGFERVAKFSFRATRPVFRAIRGGDNAHRFAGGGEIR